METSWDAYAPFYDWENERTFGRRDIAWWKTFIPSGRTLELGSGTGRLLIPLARTGAAITGVDFSSAMLDKARVRARRLPRLRRPGLVRGDIRALSFADRTFSLVLAPYGVLQSLTTDDDLDAALASVARVLKRRGTFGIDLVPDLVSWKSYRKEMTLRGRLDGKGVTLVESVRQDRGRGLTIFDEEFIVGAGPRAQRHQFSLTFRTLAMPAFLDRLTAAEFSVQGVHGDYRGGAWTLESDAWVVVATRK